LFRKDSEVSEMAQDKDEAPGLELIDSHCHLDFSVFDDCRDFLIEQCHEKGIKQFIVPGVTADTWARLRKTSDKFPSIHPAYGLHPYFLKEHVPAHVEQLKNFLQYNPSVAVGEIGLDYYIENPNKKLQNKLFSAQLDVAHELNLPIILHVRKAHDDVLLHLKKAKVRGGAVHAFNGSYQQATRYIDLGFKLGFGGALTYDRAKHLRELITQLPLNAILLETDSPDMAPAEFTGQYNTPLTVLKVLEVMSHIRSESMTAIGVQCSRNTRSLFSI